MHGEHGASSVTAVLLDYSLNLRCVYVFVSMDNNTYMCIYIYSYIHIYLHPFSMNILLVATEFKERITSFVQRDSTIAHLAWSYNIILLCLVSLSSLFFSCMFICGGEKRFAFLCIFEGKKCCAYVAAWATIYTFDNRQQVSFSRSSRYSTTMVLMVLKHKEKKSHKKVPLHLV